MKRVRNGKTIGAFIAASFSIVLLFANGSTFAQSSDGGSVSARPVTIPVSIRVKGPVPPESDQFGNWALAETNLGQFAFYAQDEIAATKKLTFTAGLRVDMPLYFDTKTTITEISILDLTGKIYLQTSDVTGGISLSALSAGIYVVKIADKAGNVIVKKFCKI